MIALLSACATGHNALVQSVLTVVQRAKTPADPTLDPAFQYLRLTRGNRVVWMWQGNSEIRTDGIIEVFYSATGEILRLQNGRIVGASGLPTEWRRVTVNQPAWSEIGKSQQAVSVMRQRDIMPGYRTGVQDELVLHPVSPPARSALKAVDPEALTWFEERSRARTGLARFIFEDADALPPSRYAVDLAAGRSDVIYSEVCLAPDFCFTWQRWSAAMQETQQASP